MQLGSDGASGDARWLEWLVVIVAVWHDNHFRVWVVFREWLLGR